MKTRKKKNKTFQIYRNKHSLAQLDKAAELWNNAQSSTYQKYRDLFEARASYYFSLQRHELVEEANKRNIININQKSNRELVGLMTEQDLNK